MKIDRPVIGGILLVGLLLGAGILLRDLLLVNFVKPIALLVWVSIRLISSIDQAVYWIGLILLILLVTLWRFWKQHPLPVEDHKDNESAALFSFYHWRTLILLTSDETDRLNYFKHFLRELLKDLYASQQPSRISWEISEDFERGDIRLPDQVKKFLSTDSAARARPTWRQRLQRLRQTPARVVRHWTKQDQAEYYQSIAEVIAFMEKQLENEDEQ